MSQAKRKRQLAMLRADLENLPAIRIPQGYETRTYRPGDDAVWADVISRAFGGKPRTATDAREQIMDRPQFEADRLFFVTKDGEAVGTACAWRKDGMPLETGYVHMVGVVPEHRGRGLGDLLVALALQRLKEAGCRRAALNTDDFRIPAIKSYLGAGFRPVYRDDDDRERWAAIFDKLKIE